MCTDLLAALLLAGSAVAVEPTPRPEPDLERGQRLYRARCAVCHGVNGDGKGPNARHLVPAPHAFTSGVYEQRTTPSGELPTDEDLFRTITHGLGGSAMPSWAGLDAADRWQLVYYVESFAPAFAEWTRATSMPLPPAPRITPQLLEEGRALYEAAGCPACHGPDGRGDGTEDLTDDAGAPKPATDLTRGRTMAGGSTAADVFRRLQTGMDGTPMPSYDDALTRDEQWALAHYVVTLQLDG